jgi:GT2 family glycosyltransferase
MKPKVSIIYCMFNFSRTVTHMAMASLANVRKFTDDEDYELVIVENQSLINGEPMMHRIRDEYDVLKLDTAKRRINKKDAGYYKSLNQGAKMAEGKYLVFIQPDVFVHEGWLDALCYYLDNDIADVVWADQFPASRSYVKRSYEMGYEEAMKYGGREAGCLIITKEGFDKTGGWDDRLFNEYGEAAFYNRIDEAGLRWTSTCKSRITHITAGVRYSMWDAHPEIHEADMNKDGKKWEEIKNG